MPKLPSMSSGENESDWYLREWMKALNRKQSDLARELGWDKPRVSKLFNGRVPYRKELVNELSAWLGIRPFELLMHPREAASLKRLRDTAAEIVAGIEQEP